MTAATGSDQRGSAEDLADTRAVAKTPAILRWLGSSGSWVLLLDIALIIVFTILSPKHVFWSLQNLEAMLLAGTVTLLLALGIAMLLGAGAIDLSVAANLVLSSVVAALTIKTLAEPIGVVPSPRGCCSGSSTA